LIRTGVTVVPAKAALQLGFQKDLVYVAPHPVFFRFKGLDDWMPRLLEMLASVFILRGVTTAHMLAGQAQAQMNPSVPDGQAIFATVCSGSDIPDLIEVSAFLVHSPETLVLSQHRQTVPTHCGMQRSSVLLRLSRSWISAAPCPIPLPAQSNIDPRSVHSRRLSASSVVMDSWAMNP
jgi:hypothetical protein